MSQRIPAAQYLRMSTEHQQYSFENQSAAIQTHAESYGFEIVRTYSDSARSGVVLKRRPGLTELLQHVVSGTATYQAILVYDVSRWGRFQDSDEAAHYEFLCKSAQIPVRYCAEVFTNDGSISSLLMKALKRTMAAEYSRELGTKVLAGQKRLAILGFKQGGRAGYGLRRLLVSPGREAKQALALGERKSIATDRVILAPGPALEVQTVRDIYRMLLLDRMSTSAIARELNAKGIESFNKSKWNYDSVNGILTRPKYCGYCVFNRTSSRLYSPKVQLPKSEWVVAPGAFEPLVDRATFDAAQEILENRTIRKSNERLLQELKALLQREGRLSRALVDKSKGMARVAAYTRRFGNLQKAYELVGYGRPEQFGPTDKACRTRAMRSQLFQELSILFSTELSIVRKSGRFNTLLELKDGLHIRVLVIACFRTRDRGRPRWRIHPEIGESNMMTLMARLDESNLAFLDFHLFTKFDRSSQNVLRQDDWRLMGGARLSSLREFMTVVRKLSIVIPRAGVPLRP